MDFEIAALEFYLEHKERCIDTFQRQIGDCVTSEAVESLRDEIQAATKQIDLGSRAIGRLTQEKEQLFKVGITNAAQYC
jgi:hypothetical protein